jgi:alpha,alpha-trehalase
MTTILPIENLATEIESAMSYTDSIIHRRANGVLRHNYLVPGGPYEEQWDWDAFFMALALYSRDRLKGGMAFRNWALNYLENADVDGRVPGCMTPEGPDPRLHQIKPLLAQGCLLATRALGESSWLRPHWSKLQAIINFRRNNLWSEKYDLAVWYDSMESGADNNVAALEHPHKSVIAVDVNTFMVLEFRAMSLLSEELDDARTQMEYRNAANQLQLLMERILWNENDGIFYNLFSCSGKHIPRVSYSCFLPLWGGLATQQQANRMIQGFLMNPDHMRSPWGIRTLSRQDPTYNNVNMINPHSNWQGPIWPIATYLYFHGLLRYGFREEALWCAESITGLVLDDIRKTGGMHENYNAETGEPLAAPNFVSWNILVRNMIVELRPGSHPLSCLIDQWQLQ